MSLTEVGGFILHYSFQANDISSQIILIGCLCPTSLAQLYFRLITRGIKCFNFCDNGR